MRVQLLAGSSGDSRANTFVSTDAPIPYTVLISAGVLLLLVAAIVVLLTTIRRRLVDDSSVALRQLEELNLTFRPLVARSSAIKLAFATEVSSKAKYDRYDLLLLMNEGVLEHQQWIEQEIAARLSATLNFGTYHHDVEAIEYRSLGKSSHPRIGDKRFVVIEQKLFLRKQLPYPFAAAHIVTKVSYTSPKGQNSYARHLVWNFDELRYGLQTAIEIRAGQTTAEALRRRERSLMTSGVRMKILRRDNYRCRMCGASASDGASLHVDHITPVSLGGRTLQENLQTLCQSCNLGKSNHFIG